MSEPATAIAPATLPYAGGRAGQPIRNPAARRSRGRIVTGLLVLVSFILTAVLQGVTQDQHHELVKNTGAEAKLDNLNSFSLALLLGGLRGPLVMLLWTSSETQKQDRDLEDFGSKIELIRLLQPEYDSVHIFQMWNLAYNVSVQMANKSNKYATIIDAIEYGYNINVSHRNDINIVYQLGQMFYDKLGSSAEKEYYTARVRRETLPDVKVTLRQLTTADLGSILNRSDLDASHRETILSQAQKSGAFTVDWPTALAILPQFGASVTFEMSMPRVRSDTGRRLRLDPMVDFRGKILESLTAPTNPRPAGMSADAEWNNGAPIQYLQKFAPYPYGVPPMVIGYEYYKQAQVLKDVAHQKNLQLSDLVVDNRPAVSLKWWSEAEWGEGRFEEMKAIGLKPFEDRGRNETPSADLPLTTAIVDRPAADKALYHYDLVAKIADESEAEYIVHQRRYPSSDAMFRSYRDALAGMKWLVLGDAAYLRAMRSPADRASFSAQAAQYYAKALSAQEVIMLKYYVADEILEKFLGKIPKESLETKLTPAQLTQTAAAIGAFLAQNPQLEPSTGVDRREAERYVKRAYQRLSQLNALPK